MKKRICVAFVAAAMLALSGGGWKWKVNVQPAHAADTSAALVAPTGWSWGDAPEGWSWGDGWSWGVGDE